MRRYFCLLGLTMLTVFMMSSSLSVADARQELYGLEHYTPTKLEWLAVTVNTGLSHRYSVAEPYHLQVIPIHNEDTLLIHVRYHPQLNREVLNIALDSAREVIHIHARSKGWNSWLKVRERIERISHRRRADQ